MVIFVQHWRVICGEYCVVVLLYVHTVNEQVRERSHPRIRGWNVTSLPIYPFHFWKFEKNHISRTDITSIHRIFFSARRLILSLKEYVGNASEKVGVFFPSELPKMTSLHAAFFRLCLGASVFAFLSRVYKQMPSLSLSLSLSAPIACVGGWHFPKGKGG